MRAVSTALAMIAIGAGVSLTNLAFAQQSHDEHQHSAHGAQSQPATPGSEKPTDQRPKLPLCPVMEEPVDFSVKTMTADGPVYFCCDSCIKKFEKDPAKYGEKVAEQRKVLAKLPRIQVTCPVSGKPVDGKTTATVGGQTVAFCCEDCVPKYEKDPAKYKTRLQTAYTYQTRCPVTGKKIDPAAYKNLATGQRVYFCSKGCTEKFSKDPAQYVGKLGEQGFNVDLEALQKAEKAQKSRPKETDHQHDGQDHGQHAGGHQQDSGAHDGHDHAGHQQPK